MTFYRAGRRWGAALLAAGLMAGAAGAQNVQYPAGAVVQPLESGTAAELAEHVRTLASNPTNLTTLLAAGEAALKLGDIQAALTFFARAEEVAPRDGRAKAGMGSAFVHNEQPQAALKFFADAVALGLPAAWVAKDRGLAYDMIGDTARAQADYTLALQRGPDPEVERRLALSRAIAGDRAGALALLEPQLQRQDRAAWRARAFVLALTGDTAGAVQAVSAVMGPKGTAMQPFLARLPQLSAADKAMAVHFGHFPRAAVMAPAPVQTASAAPTTAGRPDGRQAALGSSPARASAPTAKEPSSSRSAYPRPQVDIRSPIAARMEDAARRRAAATAAPVTAQAQIPTPRSPRTQTVATQPAQAEAEDPAPAAPGIVAADLRPSAVALDAPSEQPAASLQFADVAALVAALPGADAPAAEPVEARPKPKPAPAKKAEPAPPKEPGRIWVQLAAAQDKGAFPAEFRRLQRKAGALLTGKTAWTTPLRSTNRLLVGPFRTQQEARELVNQLAKVDISSYAWTSEAGQRIEKIPAR